MSAGWWERGEEIFAREDARRAGTLGACHRHQWSSTRFGGGVCVNCGETVSEGEL